MSMSDLDMLELELEHFFILEILGIRHTMLHIIWLQYFLFDSFALAAASAGHDQYSCTLLLPTYASTRT